MQPAHAEADPAQWAGGELQPSSQPAESHGSAVSPNRNTADADTADSNASGSVSVSKSAAAAAADGLDGNPASTGTAAGGQQGVGGGDPQMQLETETQLEGSVLGTGRGWHRQLVVTSSCRMLRHCSQQTRTPILRLRSQQPLGLIPDVLHDTSCMLQSTSPRCCKSNAASLQGQDQRQCMLSR